MNGAAWELLDPAAQALLEAGRERSRSHAHDLAFWSRWFAAAGYVGATAAFAFLLPSGRPFSVATFLVLTLAYALSMRVQFEIGPGLAIATELIFVPMLFALPARMVPVAVLLGLVLGQLPEVLAGRATPVALANAASSGWVALAPAAIVLAAGEPTAAPGRLPLLVAILAAQFASDFLSSAVREYTALGVRPAVLLGVMKWVFGVDTLLAPVGLAAAIAARASLLGLLLPLPLLVLIRWFAAERRAGLDSALELSQAYRGTALLLGDVIEADDAYTAGHSRDVVSLTLAVVDAFGLSAKDRRYAEFTALLHDVGKIRIPAEILQKPGPLTPEERKVMETHVIAGEELLNKVGGMLGHIGHVVRSCHERWDGKGYPDGLAGEEIPLIARIVTCCDAFDAMTTNRPYRDALPLNTARRELVRCAGTQFDPAVTAALLELVGQDAVTRAHA
jgi:HD-GYP domain-containing protein (c-di-GMP phosphodiesterase class II)